jgi:hypothetical protein
MKTNKNTFRILCFLCIPIILITVFSNSKALEEVSAAADLADRDTIEGFPSYSNSILASVIVHVDAAILEQEKIVQALSHLPEVKTAKWEDMKALLTVFQDSWKDSGVYWFALPDGHYYTVEKGLMDRTLQDRPYFPKVMGGQKIVGDLVVSRSTGMKSTVIVVPIFDSHGKIIGALGATLFLEKLSKDLAASLALPVGTFFYALSEDGTTALHMRLGLVFDNPLTKDSPTMKAAAEKMLSTDSGEAEYEFNGYHKRVRYMSSGLTGWCFAFGINTAKL